MPTALTVRPEWTKGINVYITSKVSAVPLEVDDPVSRVHTWASENSAEFIPSSQKIAWVIRHIDQTVGQALAEDPIDGLRYWPLKLVDITNESAKPKVKGKTFAPEQLPLP